MNKWGKVYKKTISVAHDHMPKQTISLQIFQKLSSTNFAWFILEYLDLNVCRKQWSKSMKDTYEVVYC